MEGGERGAERDGGEGGAAAAAEDAEGGRRAEGLEHLAEADVGPNEGPAEGSFGLDHGPGLVESFEGSSDGHVPGDNGA